MAQYEQKYENKNEVKIVLEKLKILKDEFKYSKDLLKNTENKIKNQNLIILNTEEKCQKIKENIEFKKRNKDIPSLTSNTDDDPYDNISVYEEQMKFSGLQINNEEKNYKKEINKQQNLIAKINEEITLLNIQLKEKEQEIRINDLKLREFKKINRNSNNEQSDNYQMNYNSNPRNYGYNNSNNYKTE